MVSAARARPSRGWLTGSEPSSGLRSSTWTSSRVRSTWARNSWPSPAPSLAPSIRPGMSAITSWRDLALQGAQARLQRRERIAGDLGMGAGQAGQQRGLAGVGQPDQPDVGQQLELHDDPALLAGQAALGEPGGLVGRAGEALVAPPAGPPAGDQRPLTGDDEVVTGPVALDRHLGAGGTRAPACLRPRRGAERPRRCRRAGPCSADAAPVSARGRAASRCRRARRHRRGRRHRRRARPWGRGPRAGSSGSRRRRRRPDVDARTILHRISQRPPGRRARLSALWPRAV